jgi:Family of unknown function (DUF6639)
MMPNGQPSGKYRGEFFKRLVLAFAVCVLAEAAQAERGTFSCPDPLIRVTTDEAALVQRVCKTAAQAQIRFEALGLTHNEQITIVIAEDIDGPPGHCVALYDTDSETLKILPEDRLADAPGRLRPFPRMRAHIIFDSLIVHELAHAYLEQTAAGIEISRLAHEYLAYALQLDALPDAQRIRILNAENVTRPVALTDFSEALLSFYPANYAAMAWLHFSAQDDVKQLIADIVARRVIFQTFRE